MRSLIDMAAERGAFIDQSQSLNLFLESPTIGKLSSMYMYAWKKGLKTTYYLRSRPASKIAKATVPVSKRQRRAGRRLFAGKSGILRGVPVRNQTIMILDPGFNLTLRPMKYPVFFEMFKTAIKNTWTVEEVDFSTDVTDLRSRMKPVRTASDQAPGCLLRDRRQHRRQQSRAESLQARQLAGSAHVSLAAAV